MSKELPYFRFIVQEWQNGDISIEDYEVQGLFINVCAYYWVKDCSITLALLKRRFRNDIKLLNHLLDTGILKHDDQTDFIQINFLNEQFDQLSKLRKSRQDAGSKGGKQKSSKAKAKLKQNRSYKDKDKDKDKDKESFDQFWDLYDYKKGKTKAEQKWNKLTDSEREKAIRAIPAYIESTPDKNYRKHPATWLNGKHWEDEVIIQKSSNHIPSNPIDMDEMIGAK